MPISKLPLGLARHTQVEPATTWVIKHSHGYPVVDVYIQAGASVQKIIPKSIVYIDETTVEVRFNEPRAGYATVII